MSRTILYTRLFRQERVVESRRPWLHAGVLQKEMFRLKLNDMEKDFVTLVRGGLCMVDRDVAYWIKKQLWEVGISDRWIQWELPLKFIDAITAVLPGHPLREEFATARKDETECHVFWLMACNLQKNATRSGSSP